MTADQELIQCSPVKALLPILCLSVTLAGSRGAEAQAALGSVQDSHIGGHVPAEADFQRLLVRDLTAYFVERGAPDAAVTYELLREGATQSGAAYPKYYLWVRGKALGADLSGAVRVAAIGTTRFEVTDFISRSTILANPDVVGTVFPALLVEQIKRRAAAP